jgi:hypothetical protein
MGKLVVAFDPTSDLHASIKRLDARRGKLRNGAPRDTILELFWSSLCRVCLSLPVPRSGAPKACSDWVLIDWQLVSSVPMHGIYVRTRKLADVVLTKRAT